ncbi:uncharacterized protein [Rutidosis leptorrhynchoides]|uniref:uncharacterized protein n=1 Tax=Rutidosis leptorrhynchoides TaxID=125765 RepID=UPI003A98E242
MGESGDATGSLTLINKLDFGDPLYLHPSDTTSGTPIISIKLKGTENYNIWSRSMLLALGTKNKHDFINESCVKSTTDATLASQWDICNTVVLSWMLGTLSEELYNGQIYSTNALTVWNDLKETYDKIDGSFLMGLNDAYMSVRSNILLRDPLPDVKTAYAIIAREESHKISSSKDTNNKTQTSAFEAQGPIKHNNNNNVSNFHNSNRASTSGSSPISFSNEQIPKLLSLINDVPTSVPTNSMSAMEVGHPNGTQALIKGIGNLVLNNFITLKDVLIVSEYYDLRGKKIKGIGKEEGGLYIFNNSENKCKDNFNDNFVTCAASSNLWHMRLGHPSDQVLLVLKNKLNLKIRIEEEPCDICDNAKQSRSPFPLSDHKTSSLGELVHLNLWGPFKIQTKEGFKSFFNCG